MEKNDLTEDTDQKINSPDTKTRRYFIRSMCMTAGAILTSQFPRNNTDAGSLDYGTEYERLRDATLKAPSRYKVHMFRKSPEIADVSLERVRFVGVIFWPKGETPKQQQVQAPFERMYARVGKFWEREFLNRATIKTEVLPYTFVGKNFAKDYPNTVPILKELRNAFENQVEDPTLKSGLIELIDRNGRYNTTSSEEFLSLSLIIMHGETSRYPLGGYGSFGISYLPAQLDDVLREGHIANYIAHESGHSFGLPDQYPFSPPSLPNRFEDSDPRNIMGISAFSRPLEQQRLANSARIWVLNHQNRQHLQIVKK